MSNHLRPDSVIPKPLDDMLLALAQRNRHWMYITVDQAEDRYRVHYGMYVPDAIVGLHKHSGDSLCLLALSWWLADGPKVFRPTAQQQEALGNVSINLSVTDYVQPFPAILVETNVPPFVATLVCQMEHAVVCYMVSKDHENDGVTVVNNRPGNLIEEAISKFTPEMESLHTLSEKASRIALNSCLALANYGHHSQHLFPHEAANDRGLVNRGGQAGERAAKRLRSAPTLLTLPHEVVLHAEEQRSSREPGEPTGREVCSHWRRGHWAKQPYGQDRAERKLIFRKPKLVRADKVVTSSAPITTTYRTGG
jgi:hypothetical protein